MKSVILVDDEKDLCDSLSRVLRREYPEVTIRGTSDPTKAKTWLLEERPGLVITDIRMPEISGLELLALVNDRWGTVPTIIMTAFASPELDEVLELGTFYYLPKPFRNQSLIHMINRIVGNYSKEEGNATPSQNANGSLLADVVQLHALASSSGVLEVLTAKNHGQIHFSKGTIVHAEEGPHEGQTAFNNILSWRGGKFSFSRSKVDGKSQPTTIKMSSSKLVQNALQMLERQSMHGSFVQSTTENGSLEKLYQRVASRELLAVTQKQAHTEQEVPVQQFSNPQISSPQEPSTGLRADKGNMSFSYLCPSLEGLSHNVDACLEQLGKLRGFISACVVDLKERSILAALGDTELPWKKVINDQKFLLFEAPSLFHRTNQFGTVEDLILTYENHFHVLRPCRQHRNIFFSTLLRREASNLALVRITLAEAEQQLVVSSSSLER